MRVAVIVLGVRLISDRSLARESALTAYPKAPSGREALPVVRLRLFHLRLSWREGRRRRSGCPSSGQEGESRREPPGWEERYSSLIWCLGVRTTISWSQPRDMNSRLSNQTTVPRRQERLGFSIQNLMGVTELARSGPYLARQLSVFRKMGCP